MGKGCRTVNLEAGMPTADLAVRRLTYEIASTRGMGFDGLKIIHGYGSSGKGGRIRVEARGYLARQLSLKKIKAFVPGEEFSIFDEGARKILAACPDLRKDNDLDRSNNGVTFILL